MALNPRLRKKFGLIFGSFETCASSIASYIPNNSVRVMCLRVFGARLGKEIALHHGLHVRVPRRITMGSDIFVAEGVTLDGRGTLNIGSHVSINRGVQIWTAQHEWQSHDFAYVSAGVNIGDLSWICSGSIILPGVDIGEGAVVAAGSVVSKSVEPWTLVGGNPARKLRDRPKTNYALNARESKVWWW